MMTIDDLEDALEFLTSEFDSTGFSIETNKQGEVVIFTGLVKSDDGELSPLDDEEEDLDIDTDTDFESLEDEEDSDDE
jgi:hypothetical protein